MTREEEEDLIRDLISIGLDSDDIERIIKINKISEKNKESKQTSIFDLSGITDLPDLPDLELDFDESDLVPSIYCRCDEPKPKANTALGNLFYVCACCKKEIL